MKKYLFALIVLCVSLTFMPANASSPIRFSREIILLKPFQKVLRHVAISPDGNFVFTNAETYEMDASGNIATTRVLNTSHLFWNLSNVRKESGVTMGNPWIRNLDQDAKATNGFSPDNKYLAVKTSKELQLYTLPYMQFLKSIPAVTSRTIIGGYLSWSPDSRLLASWVDGEVIVWDIQENVAYRYPMNYKIVTIKYIDNGWFIQTLDQPIYKDNSINPFIVCSLRLEKCDTYQDKNKHTRVLSNNGQIFVVQSGDSLRDGILGIWKRSEDGKYQLDTEYPIDKSPISQHEGEFCSQSFSPDGVYLISTCPQIPTQIWEANPLKFRQEIINSLVIWLPDSSHFVSWEYYPNIVLRLYEVGQNKPLDNFDLEQLSGLEDIKKWMNGFILGDKRIDVDKSGQHTLINLGFAALVIPIEYQ
ncbi:MAG: hypothetical protein GC179_30150 [Anaerolineaceae bacterium]|nr:hypothetical protein [Anaerolineaceae bacterium]